MTPGSGDPGVPAAVPRTLIRLRDRLGVEAVDRLWIFPPVRRGRREQGLIVATTFLEGQPRRNVITVAYAAEETGKGINIEPTFTQEGEAPPDRFPELMSGVVRRSGEGQGEPREVEIGGSQVQFEELMEEFDEDFLGVLDR